MDYSKTQNAQETKLHFLDYWRIIRIRKTVILAVFLLVVLTTTMVTMILPKTYSSTVRIAVGKDTTDIAPLLSGMQNQGGYDPFFIQTEFEKIKSKSVLHEVIEQMDLTRKWASRYGVDVLKVPEAFQLLQQQINVRQFRNTSLIEIEVMSEDPKEAAEIANKIAYVYRESRLQNRSTASSASIDKLKEQLDEQDRGVKVAQTELDRLRGELGVSDFDALGANITLEPETVRAMEREKNVAEAIYVAIAATYKKLESMPREQLRHALPTFQPDPHLTSLLEDLKEAKNLFQTQQSDLGQSNPELQKTLALISNVNEMIEARVSGIMSSMETQVSAQEAKIKGLETKVAEKKKEDATMMAKYRPYFQAKRDFETAQRLRETIQLRIVQETVDASLPKSSIVEITDKAEPPLKPSHPKFTLNIVLGVIVGLLMGFGLAFFIEYLDTSVKTIDDVERALQAPVLGVIPQNVGALIHEGVDSPHAEAYRVLRTNILFSRKDPTFNTVTVVSGGAGEGKSTTIFNLATIFAQNGDRVLVVDSDLRRPSLHKLLKVSNSIGLTNYLLKQNSLEEVIQTTAVPTLNFLPSGKLPSSSLGILNSSAMKDFIHMVKKRYDFVFFDSPPIMGVSDASVLASEMDMAVLVIQYRKYPQAMTIRAKQMVEKVGGNLLGVVLNNINISQDSYYYYYSGYYYDYYSKHDDDEGDSKGGGAPKKNGKASRVGGDRAAMDDLKPKY